MIVRSAFPDIHNTVEDAVAEGSYEGSNYNDNTILVTKED
jgi:hypothetical protein